MSDADEPLVCVRCAMLPRPSGAVQVDWCSLCGAFVWVALPTPKHSILWCWECAARESKDAAADDHEARIALHNRILDEEKAKAMKPKRYLGEARLKSEGAETVFDEGVEPGPRRRPRGEGHVIRDESEGPWYVVRDEWCSYDIDDDEAKVWTLSRSPDETGWETDGGYSGYGLSYGDAQELASAANRAARR